MEQSSDGCNIGYFSETALVRRLMREQDQERQPAAEQQAQHERIVVNPAFGEDLGSVENSPPKVHTTE
jgi:hypothetical protein